MVGTFVPYQSVHAAGITHGELCHSQVAGANHMSGDVLAGSKVRKPQKVIRH